MLFVAQQSTWDKICATGQALPALRKVVVASAKPASRAAEPETEGDAAVLEALRQIPVQPLAQWLAEGGAVPLPPPPSAEDLAAVVYTSGTTGKPKGVMLTHRNVVSNVQAVMQRLLPRSDDVFLSFLPLSHTFERTAGYYLAMAVGAAWPMRAPWPSWPRISRPSVPRCWSPCRASTSACTPRSWRRWRAHRSRPSCSNWPRPGAGNAFVKHKALPMRRRPSPTCRAGCNGCPGPCSTIWWPSRCWPSLAGVCAWP
ncbi:hypothetical protein GY14_25695 [Delftia tsuruhatensis]|nr:hypothetical protein GY14_25695 [Delftia tsuruhatensis]